MEVVFSIGQNQFKVSRAPDGALHWSDFDGKKVSAAFLAQDGSRCVVLLDPQVSKQRRFENLFCIDREGKIVWLGELPDTDDCFTDARMQPDGLHAWTWSCYWTVFDPTDGHIIRQVFTK